MWLHFWRRLEGNSSKRLLPSREEKERKMIMMKKRISMVLVCAMCMALISVATAAEGEAPQAASSDSGSTASGTHEVVIEGEPGDINEINV